MKKTRLNGFAYDFSVGYRVVSTVGIPHINRYLMAKNNILRKR